MNIKRQLKQLDRQLNFKRNKEIYHKKSNGQWGYYINPHFDQVVEYLNEKNLKKVIDLGAGEGHVIELLNDMGFQAKGYEIEDELIEQYHQKFNKDNIIKKDIMFLTTDDIKDFEVIYFYDPFRDLELKKNFLIYITNIVIPDQTIIYKHEKDRIKNYLSEVTGLKTEVYHFLEIFRK